MNEIDYRDEHRAPYNDGDFEKAFNEGVDKNEYYGPCRLVDFFENWPAYGVTQGDLVYMYDYDNGSSLSTIRMLKSMYDIMKRTGKLPQVTIYRAVPNFVTENSINNGDWITLSLSYAKIHGDARYTGNYHILQKKVPIDHVWWDGQNLGEFGYDNRPVLKLEKVSLNEKIAMAEKQIPESRHKDVKAIDDLSL